MSLQGTGNQIAMDRSTPWHRRISIPARVQPHIPMLVDVTIAFLISRVIFYATAVVAFSLVPEYSGSSYEIWYPLTNNLIGASWRWDASWYAEIIQFGYSWTPGGEGNVAFFPLFPMLVRVALLPFTPDHVWLVGVLINHAIFFLALIAVWLYAVRHGERPIAQRTVLLLCIFPSAFFFNAAYTEATFLLTTAATLALLQRGRFGQAGMAGFLGSLARPTGIFLGVAFAIEVWRQHQGDWRSMIQALLPGALIPAGLALWMGYLWWRFDNPLASWQVQDAWAKILMFPLYSVALGFGQVVTAEIYDLVIFMSLVNTSAAAAALVLAIVIIRRQTAASVFILLSLFVPLTLTTLGAPTVSLARYVVVLFPILIPLAQWSSRWSVRALLIATFLLTHVTLAALFIRWYWVV